MKIKVDRIISIATLVASVTAICLVLKKPVPVVVVPQSPVAVSAPVQSSGQQSSERKTDQPEAAAQQAPAPALPGANRPAASSQNQAVASNPQAKAEAHLSSDGIGALLAQAAGAAGTGGLSPDSNLGSGEPNIKDQQVTYEGDMVHGKFLTEIAGKDVWVTISGHMGSKDGYATFEPTEFKVGDLSIPVSLVNPALQRKLAEQRDKVKLPE